MRVLMLSKACVVGTYQRKLEELARQGIDLTVVVPPSWRDERGELRLERAYIHGYDLVVEPIRFNGYFHIHYYPGLGRRLASVRPDIVHIDEEPYNFATWHALRLAQRAGARTLFFSWQTLLRAYPPPFSWIERDVLRQADAAIVGIQSAVDVWRNKGYKGPIHVIPQFGVDPELFRPASDSRPQGGFRIGYIGRLVPEKGLDLLLKAATGLPGVWRIEITGSGPQRQALIDLSAQLGIADRVSFDPPVASTRVPALLQNLDVLVLPSRSQPNWKEQFGRILVEAMACGVPIVGSDSGEIPRVVGNAGLIFPENNVEALRQHLACLQRDPNLRADLAQRGRARALERFTQVQIARQTIEVYHSMFDTTP